MTGQTGWLTGWPVNVCKAPVESCGRCCVSCELEKTWGPRMCGGIVKWWNMRNPRPEPAGYNTAGVPSRAVTPSRLYSTTGDASIDNPNSVIVHPRDFPGCITPRCLTHLDRQGARHMGGVPVRAGMWHGWCARGMQVAWGMSVRGMMRR